MVWRVKIVAELYPGYGLAHKIVANLHLYCGWGVAYGWTVTLAVYCCFNLLDRTNGMDRRFPPRERRDKKVGP